MCSEGSNKPLACVEGTSITPLLKNPKIEWKKAAFSQYPRPSQGMTQIPNESTKVQNARLCATKKIAHIS